MAHNSPVKLYLGTAGWSIPKEYAECFPIEGAHLERYSITLPAVEINTSFYRPHRPQTYSKWADSVPEDFRFAVKMPREITHDRRLREAEQPLKTFLNEASGLSEKLGPLLVQLPRSQPFNHLVVEQFLSLLRDNFLGNVVLEPRHHSWFAQDVEQLLANYQIARVAADPAVVPAAALPGGWLDVVYYRLHGSPQMYRSEYSAEFLEAMRAALQDHLQHGREVWCIFDNTAEFFATKNALTVWNTLSTFGRTSGERR